MLIFYVLTTSAPNKKVAIDFMFAKLLMHWLEQYYFHTKFLQVIVFQVITIYKFSVYIWPVIIGLSKKLACG